MPSTQEARSSSAEECEAVGRQELAELKVADCVTANLALPVVWWSLAFAVLEGAASPTKGVSARERGTAWSLYRNRETRNRGACLTGKA